MNNNNQYDFLDAISFASFLLGIQNLDANLTQLDKQELIDRLHAEEQSLALDIHSHLEKQDAKIDKIYDMVQRIYQLLGGGNHVQDSYK